MNKRILHIIFLLCVVSISTIFAQQKHYIWTGNIGNNTVDDIGNWRLSDNTTLTVIFGPNDIIEFPAGTTLDGATTTLKGSNSTTMQFHEMIVNMTGTLVFDLSVSNTANTPTALTGGKITWNAGDIIFSSGAYTPNFIISETLTIPMGKTLSLTGGLKPDFKKKVTVDGSLNINGTTTLNETAIFEQGLNVASSGVVAVNTKMIVLYVPTTGNSLDIATGGQFSTTSSNITYNGLEIRGNFIDPAGALSVNNTQLTFKLLQSSPLLGLNATNVAKITNSKITFGDVYQYGVASYSYTLPVDLTVPSCDLVFDSRLTGFSTGGKNIEAETITFNNPIAGTQTLDFNGSNIKTRYLKQATNAFSITSNTANLYLFSNANGKAQIDYRGNLEFSTITIEDLIALSCADPGPKVNNVDGTSQLKANTFVVTALRMTLGANPVNIIANQLTLTKPVYVETTRNTGIESGIEHIFTINTMTEATPDCNLISRFVSNANALINFNATSPMTLSHTAFSGVEFTGSTVSNHTDNNWGSNVGTVSWTGTATTGNTYEWINTNGGNWSDVNNWRVNGSVPSCIPSATDNVRFNVNLANKTIDLDRNGLAVHNIEFTSTANGAIFTHAVGSTQSAPSLIIRGDADFRGCTRSDVSPIFVSPSPNAKLTTEGKTAFVNDVTFAQSGTYTIDKLMLGNSNTIALYHRAGTIVCHDTISTPAFISSTPIAGLTVRTIDFSNCKINVGESNIDHNFYIDLDNMNLANTNFTGSHIWNIQLSNNVNTDNFYITATTTTSAPKTINFYDITTSGNILYKSGEHINITFNNVYLKPLISHDKQYFPFECVNLTIMPGRGYNFVNQANANVKISGNFISNTSACSSITNIHGVDINGNDAVTRIEKTNAPFEIYKAHVKNINSTVTQWTVHNGEDAGNNTNVAFVGSPDGLKFYWIGGTGNWSSQQHWSLTSGGSPVDGCSPGIMDTVIFDHNSFSAIGQTVTMDIAPAINTMIWENGVNDKQPKFAGSTINIYGSVELAQSMVIQGTKTINFSGTSLNEKSQTLKTNGLTLPSSGSSNNIQLNFSGGGRYDLLDDVNHFYYIHITSGSSFYSNGHDISLNYEFTYASPSPDVINILNIQNSTISTQKVNIASSILGQIYGEGATIHATQEVVLGNGANRDISFANIIIERADNGKLDFRRTNYTTTMLYIGKLQFIGNNTRIDGGAPISVDTLQYSSATTNTITSGTVITIADKLIAYGTSCGTIKINSSNNQGVTFRSRNCNVLSAQFVNLWYVKADIANGCTSASYQVLAKPAEMEGSTGWTVTASNASGVEYLGGPGKICPHELPFTQTTIERLGAGQSYSWSFSTDGGTTFTPIKTNVLYADGGDKLDLYQPGIVKVEITYGTDCTLTATRSFTWGCEGEIEGPEKICADEEMDFLSKYATKEDPAQTTDFTWTVEPTNPAYQASYGVEATGKGKATLMFSDYGKRKITVTYNTQKDGVSAPVRDTLVVYVSPKTATWLGNNSNWNDANNWNTGIPGTCTVVTIPGDLNFYPTLSQADKATCDSISFKHGGEVANTNLLTYPRGAGVELKLNSNRWYTMSTPLQGMYSGDYILSANRVSPAVYMMRYQTANPETGKTAEVATWSNPFNTLNQKLNPGVGYVVWIDNDNAPSNTFTFPRSETSFPYYNRSGQPLGYSDATPRDDNSKRLIWDTNKESLTLDLEGGGASGFVTTLVGNPFMSHLDFTTFASVNTDYKNTHYYIWTGASFDAFSTGQNINTSAWTNTSGNNQYIAPMQSFIVEKQDNAISKNIEFVRVLESMSKTAPNNPLRVASSSSVDNTLRLSIERNGESNSRALININDDANNGFDEAEDVVTMFSESHLSPAILYSVNEEAKALSINSLNPSSLSEPIELGVRTTELGTLTLNADNAYSFMYDVLLEDRLTGTFTNLSNNSYSFNNTTGNVEKRFYLYFSQRVPTDVQDNLVSDIYGYTNNHSVIITSKSNNTNIVGVEIFTLQGSLLYSNKQLNNKQFEYALPNVLNSVIVKVNTENDTKMLKFVLK